MIIPQWVIKRRSSKLLCLENVFHASIFISYLFLGGLGDLVKNPDVFPYSAIPHFPVSTVTGHAGRYTVLYCTVLYCTVLYCTVLYCTVFYCTVQYCTVCTILYCTILYYTVLYCIVLYCTVMYYTVLYCTLLYWKWLSFRLWSSSIEYFWKWHNQRMQKG